MLRPEMPPGNDSAIYLRLSGSIAIMNFLDLIHGKDARDSGLRILEVGISDVPG